ncbi:MAG: hypothetical protein LBD68_11370, partial [Zoogloeaceae bacterium]|nr:hypothetical protein [Zoogloeaceae bacterium]
QFGEGITAEQLWFSRQGNHLEVGVLGTEGDKLTFENWYYHASYQVETFQLADGAQLKNSQVAALVNAMQDETPPEHGAAEAWTDYPEDVLEIIGVQWQTPGGETLL